MGGQEYNVVTEYILKVQHASYGFNARNRRLFLLGYFLLNQLTICYSVTNLQMLGLDICADTVVGNDMLRGISGGQRKRVTTGMLN